MLVSCCCPNYDQTMDFPKYFWLQLGFENRRFIFKMIVHIPVVSSLKVVNTQVPVNIITDRLNK